MPEPSPAMSAPLLAVASDNQTIASVAALDEVMVSALAFAPVEHVMEALVISTFLSNGLSSFC
jgi:hypothetical protein